MTSLGAVKEAGGGKHNAERRCNAMRVKILRDAGLCVGSSVVPYA